MDAMLSSIISSVDGPVLPATSFVPAKITTTFGFSPMTSCRKRTSICGVVWPLIPRPTYGLPGNMAAKYGAHPSVMELPMNTTRSSPGFGAPSFTLASR